MLEVTVHNLANIVVHDLQEIVVQAPMLVVMHQGRPEGGCLLHGADCPNLHQATMAENHVGHLHH